MAAVTGDGGGLWDGSRPYPRSLPGVETLLVLCYRKGWRDEDEIRWIRRD